MTMTNHCESFISQTMHDMTKLTPLEEVFYNYQKLISNPSSFTKEEQIQIVNKYKNVLSQKPPSILTFEHFSRCNEKIILLKHARYLPQTFHTHNFVELFYVFKGSCIHDCNGKKYLLSDGDFCFWQHNIPHQIQVTSNMDDFLAVNILLPLEILNSIFHSILEDNNIISQYFSSILYGQTDHPMIIFHTQSDLEVKEILCILYKESIMKHPYYQSMMYSELIKLFTYLLRNHATHVFTDNTSSKPDSFLPVLQYIQNSYTNVSLHEVCELYHYSPAHLSRLIKKYTGNTFSQIITNKKMKQAEYLLSHTQLSITSIAQELGYHDASHFSTIFRKYHKKSSGQYRADI